MPLPRALLASLCLASITLSATHAQDQTARLVKDANRTPATHGPAVDWISPAGKGAVFTMDTLEHGPELWTTNGTPKGTRLLKEFIPGPTGIRIVSPVTFGPSDAIKTALAYRTPEIGKDIWVTDGTEAGTLCVHQPTTRKTIIHKGTPHGFFFGEYEPEAPLPAQLFFSDGTVAGTHPLNPTTGSLISPDVSQITDGPWCYFSSNKNEIWRSDGTDAGTTRLATSPITVDSAQLVGLIGERLLVSLNPPGQAPQLWSCSSEGGQLTLVASPPVDHWWTFGSNFGGTQFGDHLFFSGQDDAGNFTMWVTDGTTAGTRQIQLPFAEGDDGRYLDNVLIWRGSIYISVTQFSVEDPHYLFRANLDGTAATRLGSFSNGLLFFPAADWREDEPSLFFLAATSSEKWELWRTRGDTASTRPAREVPATHYLRTGFESVVDTPAGKIYAVANPPSTFYYPSAPLYRQRGKHGSPQRLTTKPEKWNASGVPYFYADPAPTYTKAGQYILQFIDTGRGHELWRMNPDGTGTRSVWSPPKPLSSDASSLTFHGTTSAGAIFHYHDRSYEGYSTERQLWASDGTRPGTKLLYDHGEKARDGSGHPGNFVQVGNIVFYTVEEYDDEGGTVYSLWKTDGTRDGTSRVGTSDGTVIYTNPGELVSFQGQLYFLGRDADLDSVLWRSDGTSDGTSPVTYFSKNRFHASGARNLSVVDGKLLCFAALFGHFSLWQSDGTEEGTHIIDSPAKFWYQNLGRPIDVGGMAIFRAREEGTNFIYQWWCYDAANGVVRPLREGVTTDEFPAPGTTGDEWERLQAATDTKLFYATRAADQYQIWVTDGTSAGTRPIHKTANRYFPIDLTAVGDVVYFIDIDETLGLELWRSDGTEAGTVIAADIDPGESPGYPQHLRLIDGKLYFTAQRRDIGRELFVLDPLAK